mgnify:CR=1 FL=1
MRIAIVGGGASGLITAYLLRNTHQTVVYEADSILGGHVRTLNRNVQDVALDASMVCENGVLGFDLTAYPTFRTLAERLELLWNIAVVEEPICLVLAEDVPHTRVLQEQREPKARALHIVTNIAESADLLAHDQSSRWLQCRARHA